MTYNTVTSLPNCTKPLINANKRFVSAALGKYSSFTIQNAIDSANNTIYPDNRVKQIRTYGDLNHNPYYYIYTSTAGVSGAINNVYNNVYRITVNLENNDDLIEKCKAEISSLYNELNINSFIIEENEGDKTYIDFVLYCDNIRSNIGYSCSYDGSTLTVKNNMLGINSTDALNNMDVVLQKYNSVVCYNNVEEDGVITQLYYDFNSNTLSLNTTEWLTDEEGCWYSVENSQLIIE